MYFLSLTKKIFTTVAILLGAACFTRVCAQGSVSAAPYPIEVLQPDASKIMVVGKGNIVTNYAETTDGYTIVKNRAGIYEYAVQSASGNLSASGVKAKNPGERSRAEHVSLQAVPKHARESAAARLQRQPADPFYQYQTSQGPDEAFPSTGTRKALMILIKYPDLGNTNTVGEFQNFMNQPNYNSTGSFKDYYLANSFNQLNVTTDVFGWYTAANNYDYYGRQNGYEPSQELVGEAVDAAESAGVNFSQYDNDNDGYVDGVIVVHAGPGAEEGSQMQYIWSHRWVLSNPRTYDGKTIYDYMMNPERRSSGMVGIGVFCHEFGHGLGLPDLYDTDPDNGDSEGIGNWCLMAGGAWLGGEHTPANMSAWCKMKLGWQIPTIISATGGYSLTPANNNNVSYKINTPVANEYFLLENRQKTGWDTYLPGEGLAIWHINTNATGNADEDLKLVDLEEADGLNDLDNGNGRGDAGDLFPGTFVNNVFNDCSNPDSKTYNGNSSNVSVASIVENLGTVDNVSFSLQTQSICPYCIPTATLNTCSGTISDGSGVNTYRDGTNCEWLIQPVGASSVALSFTEFATESNDYVYVYDGATTASPLLGMFSGNVLPAALISSGGSMLVVFISNASGVEQGWTASYSCQTPSFCSGISTLTDCSGSFSDGSGANNYLDYASCSWLIQPAGATSITLNFTEFETESSFDYVNVYDGPTSGYALLAQLNGTTLPASITSSGGSMFIEFLTDGSITYQGWNATYSCQNGGGNCPVNTSIFTYFGTYNGNEYYYSNNTDTWENAEANCIANCGHQVCIGSAAEQTFVESILPANEKWIGANDIASEGNFAWVSGEPFSYTNWGAGEPNGGSGENLVMMWGSNNLYGIPAGVWNDGNNAVPNYYILERPEQPDTCQKNTISYTNFNNQQLNLYPWEGQKIVFLTEACNLEDTVMGNMLATFDSVFNYYKKCTGREPNYWTNTYINSRSTVAQVPSTCGAGCGYLGFTGIELQTYYFNVLYDSVRLHNHYDQPLFYEFGRNFWFYGDKIEFGQGGAVTTGYAVFMRFMAMDAAGVDGAYFGATPFNTFRSEVENLFNIYMSDTANNLSNTIIAGVAPANPLNLGATDLFASFCFKLRELYGGEQFVENIWKEVGLRPDAVITQDAVDNFILAACAAADSNLTCKFIEWRWPVSQAALNEALLTYGSCSTNPAMTIISGSIKTESNNPVSGVTVILSDGATDTVVTGNDGLYSFSVPTGGNYTITPSKSNDVPTNTGITTSDITRIRRHVLGIVYLDSPYKTIAANANNATTSITTGDIPPVRTVVLNNTAKFPPSNSRLWEFVSSSHVFAAPAPGEPYAPFPFTETRSYTDLSGSQANQDFIGVKVGDVSGNWAAPKMGTVGEVQFAMENYQTLPGEEITIPVRVKDFNDIAGYQFTMTWNPEVIQLLEVASQSIPAYYGEQSISEGMLTTSWNDGAGGAITLNDDAIAFELKFKVTGALGTSTEIKIGSEITVSEAYTDALDLLDITATNGSVKVGEIISSLNTQHPTLNTLQVRPNPFSNVTNIIFTLPQEENVRIVIYDLLGKEIRMFNGNYSAGKHNIEWNGADSEGLPLSKGMYHVRMTTGEHKQSLKALLLK